MKATDQQIIDTIRAMSMKNYNEAREEALAW